MRGKALAESSLIFETQYILKVHANSLIAINGLPLLPTQSLFGMGIKYKVLTEDC